MRAERKHDNKALPPDSSRGLFWFTFLIDVSVMPQGQQRKNKNRNPPLVLDANVSYEPLMLQPSETP